MTTGMVALAVVVIASVLLLAFIFLRRKSPGVFRNIEAYDRLNRAVGDAVEGGTRLHVSMPALRSANSKLCNLFRCIPTPLVKNT